MIGTTYLGAYRPMTCVSALTVLDISQVTVLDIY